MLAKCGDALYRIVIGALSLATLSCDDAVLPRMAMIWPWYLKKFNITDKDLLLASSKYSASSLLSFIHIPKNGGGSVWISAKQVGIYWSLPYDAPRFVDPTSTMVTSTGPQICGSSVRSLNCCSWFHIPGTYLTDPRTYLHAPHRFCMVRDPIDRMISEFYWQHEHLTNSLCQPADHQTENQTENQNARETMNGGYLNTWVLRMLRSGLFEHDCHFLPQSSFVSTVYKYVDDFVRAQGTATFPDDKLCNIVLRTNVLQRDFSLLMNHFNLSVHLGHYNAKPSACAKHMPSRFDLTDEAIRGIEAKYADDFRLLRAANNM